MVSLDTMEAVGRRKSLLITFSKFPTICSKEFKSVFTQGYSDTGLFGKDIVMPFCFFVTPV